MPHIQYQSQGGAGIQFRTSTKTGRRDGGSLPAQEKSQRRQEQEQPPGEGKHPELPSKAGPHREYSFALFTRARK